MGLHYRRLIEPVFACENNDDLEVQPSTQQNVQGVVNPRED